MDILKLAQNYSDGLMSQSREIVKAVAEHVEPMVITYSLLEPEVGSDAMLGHVTSFLSAFPDLHYKHAEFNQAGQRVCHSYRVRGTHMEDLYGIAATGRTVEYSAISLLYYNDEGKIEKYAYQVDFFHLMRQLGIDDEITMQMLPQFCKPEKVVLADALTNLGLSQMEALCLGYSYGGFSPETISRSLGLYKQNVEKCISDVQEKFACHSYADLIEHFEASRYAHIFQEYGKKLLLQK